MIEMINERLCRLRLFFAVRIQAGAAVALCACFASVLAIARPLQAAPAGSVERYPAGSIQSVSMADTALADIAAERASIEARFSAEERACHQRFFATACIDDAKEQRRQALTPLVPIEIEANFFKRQARVQERDRALAEKLAREQGRPVATEESGSSMRERAPTPQPREKDTGLDRVARHEAKLKQIQQQDAEDAQKRAENIAAYEMKAQEVKARQAEIAARKAEKERERKAKQAASTVPR